VRILAVFVLVTVVAAPVSSAVCAFSCSEWTRTPSPTTHRHHCPDTASPAQKLDGVAHCADHPAEAAVTARTLPVYSTPGPDSRCANAAPVNPDAFAVLVATPWRAGPRLNERSSVLRI